MNGRAERAELAAWGAAVGGAGVWLLALAARLGWLRALLDLYPPSSWERVTWVLIPVLLGLPIVAQGAAVAALAAERPIAAGRAILAAFAGVAAALAVLGLGLAVALRRAPGLGGGNAARELPGLLVLGCAALAAGAGSQAAGRASRRRWMRRAAVPFALAVALAAWAFARGWVVAASDVLDRLETAAFFSAVAAGGGIGAAWAACRPGPRRPRM